MREGVELAAGGVTVPLIHCCAGLTHWAAQCDRLHLISYKWKHKLVPVWLSNCVVFIFVDQAAKFLCEACAIDVAIKAELQKKNRVKEMKRTDPHLQLIKWPESLEKKKSDFTVAPNKDGNNTYNFLIIQVNTYNLFVRLGLTIS